MSKELNALLTALYVLIDDHVVATRVGRGRAPLLSGSELITLAVAQMLQGYHCERRWTRHLRSSPPGVPCSPICPISRATTSGGKRPAVAVHGDPHPGLMLSVVV